ncbi:MAG: bifunctional DNA-formamidopyrimidine glycosylase/DNA-(apurinic or apyrimidinic site) lyase [Betaproteobacteria bacterium]|nr:bifunctional DNA-formamidopyrimidine glycosylase/DNA-(apurinic or apyrimidinic site) lyase [Betaproteobacteria bacterium]
MPELPEVETTRRGLIPRLSGKAIRSVLVRDRRLRWPVPTDLESRLSGATIQSLHRRGKYLLVSVNKARLDEHVLIHLGMTGTLRVLEEPAPAGKHDHIEVRLKDGQLLRYADPRRFGCWLWAGRDWASHPLLASLGPEPFDAAFNAAYLHSATRGRSASIKSVIMNAGIVTGVGNIYANEALFRAGIHPLTRAGRLSVERLGELVEQIRAVLAEAIEAGGSSIRDYVQSDGASGWFQLRYAVYGRAGEACRTCGADIRVTRDAQRATFFCSRCQKR